MQCSNLKKKNDAMQHKASFMNLFKTSCLQLRLTLNLVFATPHACLEKCLTIFIITLYNELIMIFRVIAFEYEHQCHVDLDLFEVLGLSNGPEMTLKGNSKLSFENMFGMSHP